MVSIRKCKQTSFGLNRSLCMCAPHRARHVYSQAFTISYCLLTSTTIVCVSILEYSWCAVNIFTCILLLVQSSCIRLKIASFLGDVSSPMQEHESDCNIGHELYCTHSTWFLDGKTSTYVYQCLYCYRVR